MHRIFNGKCREKKRVCSRLLRIPGAGVQKPLAAVSRVLFAALLITALAACSTHAKQGKNKDASGAVQDSAVIPASTLHPGDTSVKSGGNDGGGAPDQQALAAEVFKTYRIGPEDVLMFRSFDDESLSMPVNVRYDGNISLPLVPDIHVEGLTREEAAKKVREAYAVYFQDPLISLTITEPRSKKFAVMGDVARPADYPYMQPLSLLESINAAGGLRIDQVTRETVVGAQGQLSKAFLIRHLGGEREVTEYDLRGFIQSGPHVSDTIIFPGDIVYVPESINLVYVLGAVRSPGVFPMTQGTTLLQLLARAGSFDEVTARIRRVVLIHQEDAATAQVKLINVRHILKSGNDILLAPGDVVYVPRTLLTEVQTFVTQINGIVSPILSLYQQAYQAYYTKDLLEQSLNAGDSRANTLLNLQNSLANFNQFATSALATMSAGK